MGQSLHQKKILVTREKKQGKEFAEKIKQFEGIPVEVPLLKINCKNHDVNEQILSQMHSFKWIFFTSANGVDCFFRLLKHYGYSNDVLKNKQIAVVGHKTERHLKQHGYSAHFIPTIYNAETMASEFLARFSTEGTFLLVRGNRSMNVLPLTFNKLNMAYESMEVYETVLNMAIKEQLHQTLQSRTIDYVTFTSPSTIDAFVEMNGLNLIKHMNLYCVVIGTTTKKRAVEVGFKHILVPTEFTIEGMIDVMLKNESIRKG
ncbi:uroporphyrinogen-III synthase [Cerasibacillus quisquiliarum]|uniref:Uroporphyrinogen-III synthase n=1 Tax=Cerasibacillus quisquiliarum TaxID=227865 RepID=A0A511UXT3_9BACI|nr:uroporphyrinogen-III synthase [Cerasibacillus quisquiliarum]MBB5145646.1 uroporphyrinogen-III synthase [Cerasibacillus quisquiliarum]GEN31440.1 uroporphyrinogen-III synthase [Cerasibacillus quisquiliarum]